MRLVSTYWPANSRTRLARLPHTASANSLAGSGLSATCGARPDSCALRLVPSVRTWGPLGSWRCLRPPAWSSALAPWCLPYPLSPLRPLSRLHASTSRATLHLPGSRLWPLRPSTLPLVWISALLALGLASGGLVAKWSALDGGSLLPFLILSVHFSH